MKAVVIVVRGLQAGALGCCGSTWIDTPALDALAAGGVVFDWHFAAAANMAGACRNWRTGRYQLPVPDLPLPDGEEPDLLAALRARAIPTSLVADTSRPLPERFLHGWEHAVEAAGTEATLEAARQQLAHLVKAEQGLLWVDFATLLPPWHVPEELAAPYFQEEQPGDSEEEEQDEDEEEEGGEEDAEEEELPPLTPIWDPTPGLIDREDDEIYLQIQTSYAAAVSYLDVVLGELLDGLPDDVAVIVTSDCGLALGEHGVVGTVRPWLHEEIIHVPLIVRLPEQVQAVRRVAALTQAVDLAPTLAELFGVELAAAACCATPHGISLLRLARGTVGSARAYACAGLESGGGFEWCLRTLEGSFLFPVRPHPEDAGRQPQLFVKPDDRWEVNDVRQHHQEWCEQLEATLRAFVMATRLPETLKPPALPGEDTTTPGES
jgi:arylsulfatase A-like enzyme